MGIQDALPDRGLTFDEFQNLQQQDAFDSVMTVDNGGPRTDVLILEKDGEETILEYSEEEGWHKQESEG